MAHYVLREATVNDIDFIIKAIIEAEKSGSDIFSYSNVFNLSEEKLREIFRKMFLEEIDGCEFSLTSYIIADYRGEAVGTIGAWVENEKDPSSLIKSNLLGYYLPKRSVEYASQKAKVTSELVIEHIDGTLVLAVVYISPEHRGQSLFGLLLNEHINRNEGIEELHIQVMSNNTFAIRSYEKNGFEKYYEMKSENENIKQFLPFNEKLLMRKILK